MISGIRSVVPPSNGTPSLVPAKPMTAQSPSFAAALLDRRERRVLVAELVDDVVDLGLVDGVDLGRELEVLVVAELDLRADLDGRLEAQRLALDRLDDLDVRVRQRDDVLLDDRLAVGVLDEVLDGLVEHRAGPEDALEDRPRGLAGPEAGDPGAPGQAADGVADGAVELVGGDLDLEEHRAVGSGGGSHLHRRASIGWVAGARPRRCGGRRGRGRTDTPLTGHRLLRPARLPFRHSPSRECRIPGESAGRRRAPG